MCYNYFTRHKLFQSHISSTLPIIDDFRKSGMLRVVPADATVEQVFADTEKVIAHINDV